MTALRIRLLGGFYLAYNDVTLTPDNGDRLQQLLAYLLLHRAQPQSRQQIAFLFWPDTLGKQARANLRTQLTRLQATWPESKHFLQRTAQTLQWRAETGYEFDVADFELHLLRAQQAACQGDKALQTTALMQAIKLYTGDLLPHLYDDWVLALRQSLRERLDGALAELTGLLQEQRDYAAAIHYAQQRVSLDPVSEDAYRQLLTLHLLNEDRASALRVYQSCQEVLARELAVAPSPATQALLQYGRPPAALPGPGGSRPLAQRLARLLAAWRNPQPSQTAFAGVLHFQTTLIALLIREGELTEAQALLDQAFALVVSPREVFWTAELHRLAGRLLWQQGGDAALVEAAFLQAMHCARQQNAKFLELRAATDLCRLHCGQGKKAKAHRHAAEVYAWFVGNAPHAELLECMAVLEELLEGNKDGG